VSTTSTHLCIYISISSIHIYIHIHTHTRTCARTGRAGRRGFDTRGNVVFYELTNPNKIYRLVNCDLDPLQGVFSLSITHVLQLVTMLTKAKDKQAAIRAASQFVRVPFLAHSQTLGDESGVRERLRARLRHFIVGAMDFLYKRGVLTARGTPSALAPIVAHIGHDPTNLKLLALLESGVLYAAVSQCSDSDAPAELMRLLAGVFLTRRVHVRGLNEPKIVLQLPVDVTEALEGQDVGVTQWLTSLGVTLGRAEKVDADANAIRAGGETLEWLAQTQTQMYARAPAACVGGRGDSFHSCDEFARATDNSTHISVEDLPVLVRRDAKNRVVKLNSYAFEFFRHGQFETIATQHQLGGSGETWLLLDQWNKLLKTFKALFAHLYVRSGAQTTHTDATTGGTPTADVGRGEEDDEEEVPDDWDAGYDDDEDEEGKEPGAGGKEWWEESSDEEEDDESDDEGKSRPSKVRFADQHSTQKTNTRAQGGRKPVVHQHIARIAAVLARVSVQFAAHMNGIKVSSSNSVY
jgi:hypothetical protein